MRYLITGGCGFLGSNLSADAIANGHNVTVFDDLSRQGSTFNLEWLKSQGSFNFISGNISNPETVRNLVIETKPEVVFHLAGQVAMTTSISDPRKDFETNAVGTFNLLDSLRQSAPEALIVYSSTNKVYGDLENLTYEETPTRYVCSNFPNGFNETTALDFRSPYGCSKGAADQYMLDFHHTWGLRTMVFRHSSMYGNRQFATFDQGWVGWFCGKAIAALRGSCEKFSISGTGKQVRDVLHAKDMISLYNSAVKASDEAVGHAFNIGGGMANSLSLLELFDLLNEVTGASLKYENLPFRHSDQKIFVADISKAHQLLGWSPAVPARSGLAEFVNWLERLPPKNN